MKKIGIGVLVLCVFALSAGPVAGQAPGDRWYSQTVPLSVFSDDSDASSTVTIILQPENDSYEAVGWRFGGPGQVATRVEFYEDGSARLDLGVTGYATVQIYRQHPFTLLVEVESRHGREYDPGPPGQ